ncbi:HesA/MoeB/ThiF family protein [Sedimentitalea nanhaiensis]|uniref:Molybdopterin-synthase adenylyltransferase n=1 Tax=Sedimentitalea nanhaiensis TaxID=999627 RepID=A0A1I6XHI7_9RHOB|nr:molybdopterin-synthase adenylyltransferase MoeB [Sedimentitalea nanhaiensis]SFT37769.1 Molybdopterin or thiamine biosynthesis adenylyltransferase [Sedimentitalea nanhaiensis]
MLLVLFLAALLWGLGALMGVSRGARLSLLAVLFGVVMLMQLVLPDGHPIREATGQSPALWLLLGGFAAMVALYGRGVSVLRKRAGKNTPAPEPNPAGTFTEAELSRYARHIVLREIGGPGQKRMKQARVLVIGAGGLGAGALQYLAAAGIGTIGVIDDDAVENANLQRQVIHRDADIGMPKVFSAQAAMQAQNPAVDVRPYHRRLTEEIATELFADYDVILDGTDNFETRYLANAAAVSARKPLVSGALSQWEGQLSVFDPGRDGPCYQCIFPEAPAPGLAPSCAEAGVIGPLPGVIGTMMAVEAIKLITGAGSPLRGQMLIYDALYGETRTIRLKSRADCPVCGGLKRRAPGP